MEKRSPMFSIDDAFEEEHTDAIRVYGATTTTEKSPLKPKNGSPPGLTGSPDVSIHIPDPTSNPLSIKPIIRGINKLKSCDDTISRDSDSLITESQENGYDYDPSKPWWWHPKVRENWKMVLAAFSLLIIGLGLSIAGIVIAGLPINGIQGTVFFIAGVICLIPGGYHVIYIYLAVKGKRGFDFYQLPLFN